MPGQLHHECGKWAGSEVRHVQAIPVPHQHRAELFKHGGVLAVVLHLQRVEQNTGMSEVWEREHAQFVSAACTP